MRIWATNAPSFASTCRTRALASARCHHHAAADAPDRTQTPHGCQRSSRVCMRRWNSGSPLVVVAGVSARSGEDAHASACSAPLRSSTGVKAIGALHVHTTAPCSSMSVTLAKHKSRKHERIPPEAHTTSGDPSTRSGVSHGRPRMSTSGTQLRPERSSGTVAALVTSSKRELRILLLVVDSSTKQ